MSSIPPPANNVDWKNLPKQLVLYGSPGTSKSYQLKQEFEGKDNCQVIRTVFHPEYTYGDFMGKLVPVTKHGRVEYRYFAGVFLKALGMALKQLLDANGAKETEEPKAPALNSLPCTVLIIEELNRGNSAAIFGSLFQLLDRTAHETNCPLGVGWSEYSVALTQLEFENLLNEIGVSIIRYTDDRSGVQTTEYKPKGEGVTKLDGENKLSKLLQNVCGISLFKEKEELSVKEVKLPPNFLIRATMNTSDNSIYVTDAAFKRRWDWKHVDWKIEQVGEKTAEDLKQLRINRSFEIGKVKYSWPDLVEKINTFILSQHRRIRSIEDRQIGYYFIPYQEGGVIPEEIIKDKLVFFLWDTVFDRDKKPLSDLVNGLIDGKGQPVPKTP